MLLGLAGLTVAGDRGGAIPAYSGAGLSGFTAPSRKATLAALQQGRIAEYCIEEGREAGAGQVVVRIEDDVQRSRTEAARLDAESVLNIELSRVRLERAADELARFETLAGDAMASSKELKDARLAAQAAAIELSIAELEHQRAVTNHGTQRLLLEQLCIRAPFSGVISVHHKQAGETVEEREGLVTLVQLDPLLVTLDCPIEVVHGLQTGSSATVTPADARWTPRTGRIIYVNPVADAASQTCRVKLLVDNRDADWISGMRVTVSFEHPSGRSTSADSEPSVASTPTRGSRANSNAAE
jgi:RND family efflux transporter MFP subunit